MSIAIAGEFLADFFDFSVGQDRGVTDLQAGEVLLGESLDLDGEP